MMCINYQDHETGCKIIIRIIDMQHYFNTIMANSGAKFTKIMGDINFGVEFCDD